MRERTKGRGEQGKGEVTGDGRKEVEEGGALNVKESRAEKSWMLVVCLHVYSGMMRGKKSIQRTRENEGRSETRATYEEKKKKEKDEGGERGIKERQRPTLTWNRKQKVYN